MTPEHIVRLAEAEREYKYQCANGWLLTVRIPERRIIRAAVMSIGDRDEAAMNEASEKLALGAIIGWANVTMADVGLVASAGIEATAPAPCLPTLVASVLGDRLDVFDLFHQDFMRRVSERIKQAQADEKNSASA